LTTEACDAALVALFFLFDALALVSISAGVVMTNRSVLSLVSRVAAWLTLLFAGAC
jgi:hypothetical protein